MRLIKYQRKPRMKSTGKQSGSSLIETIVALLISAVGILGVASLMLTSMRHNDATLARTQSTMLANEIYEMIRANLAAAEAGNYKLALSSALPYTTQTDCTTSTCSITQIAAWDLAEWSARVGRVLPGADAAINVDASSNPMSIQVQLDFDLFQATTETFTFWLR